METFKSHPTAPSFPKLPEYKRSLGNRILQCSALSALYLNPLVGIHIFNMRRRAIPLVADAKGYAQNLDCTNCETFAAIGDSIIRGVGAKSEESIPGVLSTTMPEVKMENWSVSGMRAKRLRQLLEEIGILPEFDKLLVSVGGNDKVRPFNPQDFTDHVKHIAEIIRDMSNAAVWIAGGRVDVVPGFQKFGMGRFRKTLEKNSEIADEIIGETCYKKSIGFVDSYIDSAVINANKEGASADGFHPGAIGYFDWASATKDAFEDIGHPLTTTVASSSVAK